MFFRAQKGRFVAAPPSAPGPTAGMSAVEPPLPNAAQGETVSDYFALGSFCFQQGRNEEAAAAFRKAVQLDPGYADAWNNLAICYQNAGDTAKALEAFKKYKALSSQ
jgi:Flp pilus assembly protein TadD